ncbi:hypothetical protein V6N13_065583 [Hibiscus sabdariffa]
MKIFWLVSENPFAEVKLLASDNDVLEMVSKLPRNHYVHVYLEEVLIASNVVNVEPEINVEFNVVGSFEPEFNVEVSGIAIVSDDDSFEGNIDIDYEASKSSTYESDFVDNDVEASNDVSDVHVGIQILRLDFSLQTKQVLKEAVKMYSIKNRYSVGLKRNDNRRIQAVCKAWCPWVLWASPVDLKEPYGT